ncbi:MAG TPA: hypothetical protein VFH73_27705 [Polyangia bacterium]|nr:hypothetical protein [Polyangia bacterium]
MDGKRLGTFVAALAMVTVAACGSSAKQSPDASPGVDGNQDRGGFDGIAPTDGPLPTVDVPPRPEPQMGAGSRLLVKEPDAILVGNGQNSCTNQVPASGDRWCAFTKPSSFLGLDDLWVINVSKAAEGKTISCTGSDVNCLRLTSALFTGDITLHGFDGDSLIYYAENTGGMTFLGTVYAWRPGWTQPRKITNGTGVICGGHPTSDSAYCFGNRDDKVADQVSYDLNAGQLKDADVSILPKVESLLFAHKDDVMGVRKFQASLSPAGDYIAWSARLTPTGVETLKVQKVGDDSTRKIVATDVSRWAISPDQQKWYWLKAFNYDTKGNTAGTLEMAAFPDGAGPATLVADVGDFDSAGPKGIMYRSGFAVGKADLKLLGDRDDVAGSTKALDSGVIAVWGRTKDGQSALYSKQISGVLDQLFDMYISTPAAAAPCLLTGSTLAPPVGTFSEMGQTAVWAKYDEIADTFHGYYTNVSSCASGKFATNILSWASVADEGYIYLDDSTDGVEATIRFNQVTNGMFPARGTVVQTRASTVFGPLLPALPAVIYTVTLPDDKAKNGIYINTSLPFTSLVPAPDGGTGG